MTISKHVSRTNGVLLLMPVLTLVIMADLARAQDGQHIYQAYCSVCHGDTGDGQSRARQGLIPPPKDFTEPGIAASLTHEKMLVAVRDGKPGTAMAGWKNRLSESEMVAVVDYISKRFMRVHAAGLQAEASHGKNIYAEYCSVCHGDDGARARWTGAGLNPPPRNFTDRSIRDSLSRKQMIAAVTHGKPNTAMVGFGRQLNDQDIANVVDYIRLTFMNVQPSDSHSAETENTEHEQEHGDATGLHGHDDDRGGEAENVLALMPLGLNGDAHSGGYFYRDNCATCHGVDGDGNGPRAYFINPKPTNFTDSAHRAYLDRPALFAAIRDGVRGREMPAWGKVLSDQQIANVAEYVFTQFIQPGNGVNSERTYQ